MSYRTYRRSGYGYECRTGITEVPGTGMNVVQNSQKLTQVPGTGIQAFTKLTEVVRRVINSGENTPVIVLYLETFQGCGL